MIKRHRFNSKPCRTRRMHESFDPELDMEDEIVITEPTPLDQPYGSDYDNPIMIGDEMEDDDEPVFMLDDEDDDIVIDDEDDVVIEDEPLPLHESRRQRRIAQRRRRYNSMFEAAEEPFSTEDEDTDAIVDAAAEALDDAVAHATGEEDAAYSPSKEMLDTSKTVDLGYISSLAEEVVTKVQNLASQASQIQMVSDEETQDVYGGYYPVNYNYLFNGHSIVRSLFDIIASIDTIADQVKYASKAQDAADNVSTPVVDGPGPMKNTNGVPATSVDDEAAIAAICEPEETIEFPDYQY